MIKSVISTTIVSATLIASTWQIDGSYGVRDFYIPDDKTHTIGFDLGLDANGVGRYEIVQKAHLEAAAEYDKHEHDSDHIPVLFSGTYKAEKPLLRFGYDFYFIGKFDIDWRMNTVTGIEQSFNTAINGGIRYEKNGFSAQIDLFGGCYYLEIDDDTPREFGYTRSELKRGLKGAYGTWAEISYKKNGFSALVSYRAWREKSFWTERYTTFELEKEQTNGKKVGLRIKNTIYNLDPLNIAPYPILPWNNDIVFLLYLKQRIW